MRPGDVLATPWVPYGVTFSRDGTRLAIGGGTWYGNGGLLLVQLDSRRTETFACADLLPSDDRHGNTPTVSSLCFSDDDRLLGASMWSMRQHYAPTVLFAVDALEVRYLKSFAHAFPRWHDACPTGVLLHGGTIITRHHSIFGDRLVQIAVSGAVPDEDDVLTVRHLPDRATAASDQVLQQLTHHRLIVSRRSVITETGGSRGTYVRDEHGQLVRQPTREGLVARPLDGAPNFHIPVEGCGRITAICGVEPDVSFVTGGRNGELDLWVWNDRWCQKRIRDAQAEAMPQWPGLKRLSWVTYKPASVVAVAALPCCRRWLSVSAAGELATWTADRLDDVLQLPVPGSPRALAVHPDGRLAAVGVKQGSFDDPSSAVLLVEIRS
jgi:hypothetical protein